MRLDRECHGLEMEVRILSWERWVGALGVEGLRDWVWVGFKRTVILRKGVFCEKYW